MCCSVVQCDAVYAVNLNASVGVVSECCSVLKCIVYGCVLNSSFLSFCLSIALLNRDVDIDMGWLRLVGSLKL